MYLTFLNLKIFATNLLFGANTPCPSGGSFFGFPRWYKYLDSQTTKISGKDVCSPVLTSLNDVWLIGLAIIEILLRVAIMVAVVFVLIGGIKFITARGDTGGPGSPDKIASARKTVFDALTGLIIAVVATAVVSFIAGSFSG